MGSIGSTSSQSEANLLTESFLNTTGILINSIGTMILVNGPGVTVETPQLTIQVVKVTPPSSNSLALTTSTDSNSSEGGSSPQPLSVSFPPNFSDTIPENSGPVQISLITLTQNPYGWSTNSSNVVGEVIDLNVEDANTLQEIPINISSSSPGIQINFPPVSHCKLDTDKLSKFNHSRKCYTNFGL